MPTTLVLLPGLDGTGLLFERFVAELPPEITPVVVSYPDDAAMGYPELLEHVRASTPETRFAVLGESFSGPLALQLATDPRVRAVVLCASFVTSPLRCVSAAARFVAFPMAFRIPAFVHSKLLLGSNASPELRADLARAQSLVAPDTMAARAKAILGVDVRPQLRQCRVPVLYLAGSKDRVVGIHNANAIRRIAPGVELVTIDAPHLVLQAAPVEAAAAVAQFLARASTGRPHASDILTEVAAYARGAHPRRRLCR